MSRRGFNFIEICIAVTVMACCSIPLYFLMTMGSRGVVVSTREVAAVNHCSALMEILKGASYKQLVSLSGGGQLMLGQRGWQVYDAGSEKYVDVSGNSEYTEAMDGMSTESLKPFEWTVLEGQDSSGLVPWLQERQGATGLEGSGGEYDLPPLEAFFVRRIKIDCQGETYCFVAVQVDWPHESREQAGKGRRRSVDVRTLVVQP